MANKDLRDWIAGIEAAGELKLRAVGPERQLLMDCTAFLTARTVNSLSSPSLRQSFAL